MILRNCVNDKKNCHIINHKNGLHQHINSKHTSDNTAASCHYYFDALPKTGLETSGKASGVERTPKNI